MLAGRLGLPAVRRGRRGEAAELVSWFATRQFVPGAVVGGLVGKLIIRPVNAVLGWLFRGFNRLFDAATEVYGWTIGKLLRISAWCSWPTAACWS